MQTYSFPMTNYALCASPLLLYTLLNKLLILTLHDI